MQTFTLLSAGMWGDAIADRHWCAGGCHCGEKLPKTSRDCLNFFWLARVDFPTPIIVLQRQHCQNSSAHPPTVFTGLDFPQKQAMLSLNPSHHLHPARYYGALCRGPTCRWQLCCCRLLRPHQALGIGAGHNSFFTRRSSRTHTVRNRSFQLRLGLLHAWVLGF